MTTKLRLMSDLHLEFRDDLFDHIWTPKESDKEQILLLAGDISLGMGAKNFIEEACKWFRQVIYIPGNHEYYDQTDFDKVNMDWQTWEFREAPENFHFLYNTCYILDGVRFLGGTMWTNFNNGDPIVMLACGYEMSDYECVRVNKKLLTPDYIIQENKKFMDFLIEEFENTFDGKTVVMTHHSPGNAVRRAIYNYGVTSSAYFANIEEIIGNYDIACLHVHGHTHQNYDYLINNTRVVSNPYGYWGRATNKHFNPNLILEI